MFASYQTQKEIGAYISLMGGVWKLPPKPLVHGFYSKGVYRDETEHVYSGCAEECLTIAQMMSEAD